MRRTLALLTLVLCALPAAASARSAEGTTPAGPPPLDTALAACVTGPTEDERFAVFTASMPAHRGTVRMAMRFDLWTRPIGERRWQPVRARGFGRWQRSDRGRTGFVYTKRVERLAQAADYRVTVRFRWTQSGAPRHDRVRRTPVCRQPDQRPNLRVESLGVLAAADPADRRYVLSVINDGRTAAGAFDVGIVAERPEVRRVAGLPAGERATVEVVGPACPQGQSVAAQVDLRSVVDESDERDNRSSAACDGR